MGELQVVLLVDEAHNVVQNEDALHGIAHGLVLRFQPIDDYPGTEVDQAVCSLRIFHDVHHELRGAAHKARRAQRPARGHHRQYVAVVQNTLLGHPDAVQRERRKSVCFHFVLRKIVDVFQPVQGVVFARRVVLPELDLGAQHRGFGRHPVLHPPRRDENDIGKLPHDLQVGFEPEFRIEKIIQVLDAQITGNPRTIHDQGHRDLVHLLAPGRALKYLPLLLQHDFLFGVLSRLGRRTEMRRKPGTDLNFRAQFAGNSVSVPGFAPRRLSTFPFAAGLAAADIVVP